MFREVCTLCLIIGAALVLVCNAVASPITTLFIDDDTASASNPAPAGSIWPAGDPGGAVGGIGGAVSFTMPFAGSFTLAVQDCCLVGDIYQVFVDGESLGFTSAVPFGGPTPSSGTFSLFLSAGVHTYDIDDALLTYIGVADPWGGGVVPSIYSPAGLTDTGTATASPEPGTCALLGMGLLAAGFIRRRRS